MCKIWNKLIVMLAVCIAITVSGCQGKATESKSEKKTTVGVSKEKNVDTNNEKEVEKPSVVHNSYEIAKDINSSNVEKTEYETTYHGIQIIADEQQYLESGAIYRSLAKKVEGFYMEFSKSTYNPKVYSDVNIVCGIKNKPTWDEMKPYVDKAALVVTRENTLESVMKAIQSLDCVDGDFDYDNKNFNFKIKDLKKASTELGISQEMLGYTLAMLDEYAPTVKFEGNTYSCTWFKPQ